MSKRVLTVLLMLVVVPALVMGYGTKRGTVITNARPESGDKKATLPGEVGGPYTNSAGHTNYAFATNITTSTVAAGFDLSVINNPTNGTNSAGAYVEYTYTITNRANLSTNVTVVILSNIASSGWGISSYELWTNFGGGFGLWIGPANYISNRTKSIPADNQFQLRVRVNIPASAQDGASNQFLFRIWDPAGNGTAGVGDQWPGANAIPPATPDLANARDYQSDYVATFCRGPLILLSKSVDLTSAKPYEDLTYSIYFTNKGSARAYNLIVDDVLYTNYVRIIADSAETNNTVPGTVTVTNYYYNGTTWQPATWDNGNENSVVRVRWQLRGSIDPNAAGTLRFKVRIE